MPIQIGRYLSAVLSLRMTTCCALGMWTGMVATCISVNPRFVTQDLRSDDSLRPVRRDQCGPGWTPGTECVTQRLLLVDRHSLIYRAFFALPALTDRKGRLTNAAFGFTSMLLNALPGHELVAAAFDHPSKTFRHREYAEYKAQREKAPDDLVNQFPMVREIVTALNFATYQVEGFEADDLIGTLATQAEALGLKVDVLTGDLDALQLVSPNIDALTTRRGISDTVRYDVAAVQARYEGLGPDKMTDLKAIKGDVTDNIPGVPGVGDKTAIRLIKEYGSAEGIIPALDQMPPRRVTPPLQA